MKILNIDDDNFIDDLINEMGISKGDTISIRTPQFERTDGLEVGKLDSTTLRDLEKKSKEELKALGLGEWGEYGLWLLPKEWYNEIPEGYALLCISGKPEYFQKGVTDDDIRFGMLAYGIVPDFELKVINDGLL